MRGHRTADLGGNLIDYTSFGLPKSLDEGVETVTMTYDADHARTTKTWLDSGQQASQNVYIGNQYERRQDPFNGTRHVFYIHGADRIIGQEMWTEDAGGRCWGFPPPPRSLSPPPWGQPAGSPGRCR